MSGPRASVTTESPVKQRIPWKIKNFGDFDQREGNIQEPGNSSKREKRIVYLMKRNIIKKHLHY